MPSDVQFIQDLSFHQLDKPLKINKLPTIDLKSMVLLLHNNQLSTVPAEILVRWFKTFPESVKEIDLSCNGFGNQAKKYCITLMEGLPTSLEKLHLTSNDFNHMDIEDFKCVIRAIPSYIKVVNFNRNLFIFQNDAQQNIERLKAFSSDCLPASVKELHLEYNNLAQIPFDRLINVFSLFSNNLETIYLGENNFSLLNDEQFKELIESISSNIKTIVFNQYDFSPSLRELLKKQFPDKVQFQHKDLVNYSELFSMLKAFLAISTVFTLFLANQYANKHIANSVNSAAAIMTGLFLAKYLFFKNDEGLEPVATSLLQKHNS